MALVRYVFVVRIWHEPGDAHKEGRWRGEVQHVAADYRYFFSSLTDLSDFIKLRIGGPADEPPAYWPTRESDK